jgi:hypothetical protein
MRDELLDILRGLSQRQRAEPGGNGVLVESNYAENDITNQILEREPVASFPSDAGDALPSPPPILETAELSGFGQTVEVYRDNEKNEIHEKTKGCAGVSTEWAEGLAQLWLTRPPGDVPWRRWRQLILDARRLVERGQIEAAAAHRWTALDLFGCDAEKPSARIDQMGLIWFIRGGRVVSVSSSAAIIETASGARQSYRRKTEGIGQVVVWELFNSPGLVPG